MSKTSVQSIIQTAIISAFTIAAALIWKDVIVEFIELVVPSGALLYKLVAAIFATGIAIVAILIILNTESEAEVVIKRIRSHNHQMK